MVCACFWWDRMTRALRSPPRPTSVSTPVSLSRDLFLNVFSFFFFLFLNSLAYSNFRKMIRSWIASLMKGLLFLYKIQWKIKIKYAFRLLKFVLQDFYKRFRKSLNNNNVCQDRRDRSKTNSNFPEGSILTWTLVPGVQDEKTDKFMRGQRVCFRGGGRVSL